MRFIATILLFLMTLLAVANADYKPPGPSKTTSSPKPTKTPPHCSSGPVLCCHDVQPAKSGVIGALLELLGIILGDKDVDCGITCSPVDVQGLGSPSECSFKPVCCENNGWNGIIAIGCTSIEL